jgi:hypothetical protein
MKKRFTITMLAATAFASQLGATDCGQITRDSGFDLWCGDALCVWKVVRGDVARAPTWHEADSGVELLGNDAAISQLTPVNSNDTHCIRFELIADVEPNAEAGLDVDIEGDGTVDKSFQIPTAKWKPLSFQLFIQPPFDGIRFELKKTGPGRAAFAQIEAVTSTECEGLTMTQVMPRPNGAACITGADCASGLCTAAAIAAAPGDVFGTVCASCEYGQATDTCAGADVCGYAEPQSPVLAGASACVAEASAELGERCVVDAECTTGMCNGRCSACTGCAPGQSCRPSWVSGSGFGGGLGPLICDAGNRSGASGAPSGTNADCASGVCNGTERKECSDGRPCASPANCPVESGLAPGACTTVGVTGGSCQ